MKVIEIIDIERCKDDFQDVFTITFTIDQYGNAEFIMIIDDNTKEAYFWWILTPTFRDKEMLEANINHLKQQIFHLKNNTKRFRLLYLQQLNP